jgi:site-specific recombinase XerD
MTIDERLRSLAAWAEWLQAAGFAANDFLSGFEACTAALGQGHVRYSRGPNDHSRIAAALFIAFLRDEGILALPAQAPSPVDRWPILAEFRSWMRQHHGLQDSTLDVYQSVVFDLLTWSGGTPQIYTAALVRDFVLQRAKPHGIWRAKSITTAVRVFLRFLGATGQCAPGLDQSIPGYASWKLSSVPRYLEPADVQKVLDGCAANDARGLRDRAVMLLLARLALRAGDVAGLTLQDIDWKNGRIAVCGKGRRQEWLPLPQDVGDAILKYIQEGRRGIETDHVFAKVCAPSGTLTRASVTHIARSALRRAGVKAPINGAHLFRHSAATAMLRQGASLAGVGAVLRHRSPSTTAHYAKVDFGLLAEIAQPWPEVPSC